MYTIVNVKLSKPITMPKGCVRCGDQPASEFETLSVNAGWGRGSFNRKSGITTWEHNKKYTLKFPLCVACNEKLANIRKWGDVKAAKPIYLTWIAAFSIVSFIAIMSDDGLILCYFLPISLFIVLFTLAYLSEKNKDHLVVEKNLGFEPRFYPWETGLIRSYEIKHGRKNKIIGPPEMHYVKIAFPNEEWGKQFAQLNKFYFIEEKTLLERAQVT